MFSQRDFNSFGEGCDYEEFWRDRYVKVCKQLDTERKKHEAGCQEYDSLISHDDAWFKEVDAEKNELEKQLRQARAEIAAPKKALDNTAPAPQTAPLPEQMMNDELTEDDTDLPNSIHRQDDSATFEFPNLGVESNDRTMGSKPTSSEQSGRNAPPREPSFDERPGGKPIKSAQRTNGNAPASRQPFQKGATSRPANDDPFGRPRDSDNWRTNMREPMTETRKRSIFSFGDEEDLTSPPRPKRQRVASNISADSMPRSENHGPTSRVPPAESRKRSFSAAVDSDDEEDFTFPPTSKRQRFSPATASTTAPSTPFDPSKFFDTSKEERWAAIAAANLRQQQEAEAERLREAREAQYWAGMRQRGEYEDLLKEHINATDPNPTAEAERKYKRPGAGSAPRLTPYKRFALQTATWHEKVVLALEQQQGEKNFPLPPCFPAPTSVPPPFVPANEMLACRNRGCEGERRAGVCECSLRKAVEILVAKESVGDRQAFLKKMQVLFHPDRWVGCVEEGMKMAEKVFVAVGKVMEKGRK